MTVRHIALAGTAFFALAACGQSGETQAVDSQTASVPETGESASSQQEADTVEFDAVSGAYVAEAGHRYITFSYSHQGYSNPWLRWRDWTGTLNWDAETPENSSVNVTIDVASIDSGVDEFDDHLRGDGFFDAAAYPEITFASTSVVQTGGNTGVITGDLTIKDVTKPVTLDVVFHKGAYEERGNYYKLGFSATASVKRSDFGVGAYIPFVGDDVNIVIETEWEMPAPASE